MCFFPELTDSCRDCGNVSLQFLKDLKSKQSLARASPAAIKLIIEKILQLGKVRGAVQPRVMGELHKGLASHGLDEFTDLTPMVITVVQAVKYEFNIGVHRGIQSPDNQTVPFAEVRACLSSYSNNQVFSVTAKTLCFPPCVGPEA